MLMQLNWSYSMKGWLVMPWLSDASWLAWHVLRPRDGNFTKDVVSGTHRAYRIQPTRVTECRRAKMRFQHNDECERIHVWSPERCVKGARWLVLVGFQGEAKAWGNPGARLGASEELTKA